MNERLEKFMKVEGLTSAKFAEILSVQPSSISHLLSGRNNPSFDFISKLLLMFPRLNPRWIINGQGDIYLDDQQTIAKEDLAVKTRETIADIFSQNYTDKSEQITNNQQYMSVNSVTHLDNNSKQESLKESLPQIEIPKELTDVEIESNLSSSHSIDNVASISMSERNVERVLLLYNDNSFEFFNRK